MAKQSRIVALLAVAFVLLGVGMAVEGVRLHEAWTLNRATHDGSIAAAGDNLPLEALFSKAYWLKRYGRYDSAAQVYTALRDRGDRGFQSALHYNLGNTYLGHAIATESGAMLNFAEESYRDALGIDPEAWDAKYNLARLVKIKREAEKKSKEKKEKKLEAPQGWRFAPGDRGSRP